jgi:hypothetical protein
VGAEVAVQALEGGEAVFFSHGVVVRASWALCAKTMACVGGQVRPCLGGVFFLR